MISLQSGAFSLKDSRMRRNSAYSCLRKKAGLAQCVAACKREFTVAVPQFYPVAVYHFRTPSPGGQHPFHNDMLPAFFYGPPWKCFSGSRKRVAMCQPRGFILNQMVSNSVAENRKEPDPCRSNSYPSLLPPLLDLPLAVTQSANRPCQVPSLAQQAQPSSMAMPGRVPLWALSAVWPIARFRIAATKRSSAGAAHLSNVRGPYRRPRVQSIRLPSDTGTHPCLSDRSPLPQSQPSVQAQTRCIATKALYGANVLTRVPPPVFIHTQTSLCPPARRRFPFPCPELRPTSEAPCSTSC